MARFSRKYDANYDFDVQKEPGKRMGEKDFANMPKEPIIRDFGPSAEYRGGNINNFVNGIRDLSGISENQK